MSGSLRAREALAKATGKEGQNQQKISLRSSRSSSSGADPAVSESADSSLSKRLRKNISANKSSSEEDEAATSGAVVSELVEKAGTAKLKRRSPSFRIIDNGAKV